MKIGDFAKKYGLNITTVRYYVERALLTPERKNNQYVFTPSCMEDMGKILKYKSFRFSLEEIELLFFLEKTTKFRDETVLGIFSRLLKQKQAELEKEEEKIHDTIGELKAEIRSFSQINYELDHSANGIPFTFLPYLACPDCGRPLKLESASISDNKICDGEFLCECGYKNELKDGVILCDGYAEDTPFKAFENIDLVSAVTEELGNEFRTLIDKTYMWMYHQMTDHVDMEGSINIMGGPFSGNYFSRYCQKFSRDAIFIITDPSLKRIRKLQEYMKEFDCQTVYLAGDLNRLPLRENSIDVYLDDFSSNNCIFTYNKSQYDKITPLIRKTGCAVGLFADYRKCPKSLRTFQEDQPDFIPEKMTFAHVKADLLEGGMEVEDQKQIGSTTGKEKQFQRQVGNETIGLMGYRAIK